MSVRTPILTEPPETFSCAGAREASSATATASDQRTALFMCAVLSPRLHAEELVQRLQLSLQLLLRDLIDDPAALDQQVAIGERGDEAEVLLDEGDGEPALLEH